MKTIAASLSDLHCGSPVGILPPGQWQLRSGNVKQNAGQRLTWRIFCDHTHLVGDMRTNAKLRVFFNGDMVEGVHHGNLQVTSSYMREQEAIAQSAIDTALQNMKFDADKGDKLFFIAGTNSHVAESEERLARDFGAVPYRKDSGADRADGRYCHPSHRANINGVRIWHAHKIAGLGKGANFGNSLRNAAKNLYFDMLAERTAPPDYLIGSHFHRRGYQPYVFHDDKIEAFVLPSYKLKDDYTFEGFAPFGLSQMGMHVIEVEENGESRWQWLRHDYEQVKEVRL